MTTPFAFRDARGLRASITRNVEHTIPCPGCGAPCDGSAVGPHDEDCPMYGPNAPQGPEDYGHPSPEDMQ